MKWLPDLRLKEKWGRPMDDDLDVIKQLAGKIQERYGVAKITPKRMSTHGSGRCHRQRDDC